jgi:hypothetical protein
LSLIKGTYSFLQNILPLQKLILLKILINPNSL